MLILACALGFPLAAAPGATSGAPAPKGPPRVQYPGESVGGSGGNTCAALCGAGTIACTVLSSATGDSSPVCVLYCTYKQPDGTTCDAPPRDITCP